MRYCPVAKVWSQNAALRSVVGCTPTVGVGFFCAGFHFVAEAFTSAGMEPQMSRRV